MSLNLEPLISFSEIKDKDYAKVGKKGLMLSKLSKSKIPIPNGFIITSDAYFYFLDMARIREKILDILTNLDVNNYDEVKEASNIIQKIIIKASIPPIIETQILKGYTKLSGFISSYVAVRSSIASENEEDEYESNFLSTFLNIKGNRDLLLAIKASWASLFEPRAIEFRTKNNISHMRTGLAIIVQKMIQTEVSGVMMTIDPFTKDQSKVVIEATLGLGETYRQSTDSVNGQDQYEVDKSSLKLTSKKVGKKTKMIIRPLKRKQEDDEIKEAPVAQKWQHVQKLSDKKITELAHIGKVIEQINGIPQDIEWSMSANKIYIVKTRDLFTDVEVKPKLNIEVIDVRENVEEIHSEEQFEDKKETLDVVEKTLKGKVAFKGIVEGLVKIIRDDNDFMEFNEGDILVIDHIVPDHILWMRKASGIITQNGGLTSHAAILAREFRIPCIIGVENALLDLHDRDYVRLDANNGVIRKLENVNLDAQLNSSQNVQQVVPHFEEEEVNKIVLDETNVSPMEYIEEKMQKVPEIDAIIEKVVVENKKEHVTYKSTIHTATKVLVNLSNLDNSKIVANKDIDGVGFINGNDILNDIIKRHPGSYIDDEIIEKYIDQMAQILNSFCEDFNPKTIIYKPSNLISSDFKFDVGSHEPSEVNPRLGYNGALKYIQNPSLFNLEVEVIKTVRNKYEHKNLSLMLPLVRDIKDLREIKKIITSNDLKRSSTFKLYLSIEAPSCVLLIHELLDIGIDGVFIFARALSSSMNVVDLENPAYKNFNVFNEAFMLGTEVIIKTAHKQKVPTGIVLEKGEFNEDSLKNIIEWGAIYLSVDPHYVDKTREIVADIEKSLILSKRS